jgi:hypothetical protein
MIRRRLENIAARWLGVFCVQKSSNAMQHTFQHHIETGDTETALTIEYEYAPPSHGTFPDDSTESRIEILSATLPDETEYEGDTNEFIPLCWDDLLEYFGQ